MTADEAATDEARAEGPREPEGDAVRLALFYALPGAAFGLAFWLLVDGVDAPTAPLIGLLIAILIAPLAWTLTTEPDDRIPPAIFAGGLAGLLGTLGALAWTSFGEEAMGRVVPAILLIAYVATPFFRTQRRSRGEGHGPWHYPALFADAWNLPVVLTVATAFAGAAYGMLWLLAAMFALIGIDALGDVLKEGVVSLPLLGALTASGIGVTRRSERVLLSLRGVLFGLLRVIAPVFALGTALFSAALLFQGLDALWDGWSPAVLLVTTVTAALFFVNAVVQDRNADRAGLLGVSARLQCVVLPILAGLAGLGMALRIGAYGLTPERIMAALIAGVTLAYALTYAAAGLTGRWAVLRRGNVVLAGALVGLAVFTLTPLFALDRWSVASQVARLEAGEVAPEAFDVAALAYELGAPGEAALGRLRAEGSPAIQARIRQVIDETDGRYEAYRVQRTGQSVGTLPAAIEAGRVRVHPAGAALPELVAEVAGRQARSDRDREIVVILEAYAPNAEGSGGNAYILERDDAEVRLRVVAYASPAGADVVVLPTGRVRSEGAYAPRTFEGEAAARAIMDAAASGDLGSGTVTIEAPAIGGVLFPPVGRPFERGMVVTRPGEPDTLGAEPLGGID